MFPANVYAALEGLTVSGAPAMGLVPRSLLQLLFLSATLAVLLTHTRPHPAPDADESADPA